jgi:hypothetical protein
MPPCNVGKKRSLCCVSFPLQCNFLDPPRKKCKVIMLQHIRNLSSKVGNTSLVFVHCATMPSFEAYLACKQTLLEGKLRDIAPVRAS